MKLATLKNGARDGRLVAVSRDLSRAVDAKPIAGTMQAALEQWSAVEEKLQALYQQLNAGTAASAFAFSRQR